MGQGTLPCGSSASAPGSAHWNAYGRFIQGYAATPGFRNGWNDVRHAFADDYVAWMDRQTAVAA